MRIVLFDRKKDSVDCQYLMNRGYPIVVLHWSQLEIPLLQPVKGLELTSWINIFVQLLASNLNIWASRRLMIKTLARLYDVKGAEIPVLSEWVQEVEGISTRGDFNLAQYRNTILTSLDEILYSFGKVVEHRRGPVFEEINGYTGCVVIQLSGLQDSMASLLASLFINHAYESRGMRPEGDPILFVVDDAMPLVRGDRFNESKGTISPICMWSFMGRSRGIGFLVAGQNYAQISPTLRSNVDTLIVCQSSGDDLMELSRSLQLTREQTQKLFVLQVGEVVARAGSVWPLPVYGRVPRLP